jgi:hypothetical protein
MIQMESKPFEYHKKLASVVAARQNKSRLWYIFVVFQLEFISTNDLQLPPVPQYLHHWLNMCSHISCRWSFSIHCLPNLDAYIYGRLMTKTLSRLM